TVADDDGKRLPQRDGKTPEPVELSVDARQVWDVDEAHLYTEKIVVEVNGEASDESETEVGSRKIEIDAQNGLRLNGRKMKLRGGCIHHDNALLGACGFAKAEERKIRIVKDAGYNAIRTAHNPPSRALLEACDRIGMLVLN